METQDLFGALTAMNRELETGPELYRPADFWIEYAKINMRQLAEYGLENFKRSINQTYYNWIPEGFQNNQFRNLIAYLYAFFVGLLWHYTRANDPYGLIDNISEPTFGNPIDVRLNGRLISQDIANSARELLTILKTYPFPKNKLQQKTSVLEIGAGYGRVAYLVGKAFTCRYVIVDITPALYVSQFYLSTLFGETHNVFKFRHFDHFDEVREEFENAHFVFLTPNQLEMIPDGTFEVSIAISSLHEMRVDQIDNFLHLMQRKTTEAIYIKQWLNFQNPIDKITLLHSAYDLGSTWRCVMRQIDPVQDLFFEAVWVPQSKVFEELGRG
jgi:putative sugar O-methyltransferase